MFDNHKGYIESMASGFGIIDYIVVSLITFYTVVLLKKDPQRLLFWLPLFLTVDFFVPLGTQLTPSRFVPLLLGVWLLKWRPTAKSKEHLLMVLALMVLALSLAYSLLVADAGIRPVFRVLNYCNLIFLFVFVNHIAKEEDDLNTLLWGLVLAGGVHGVYGLYQLVAVNIGLPFRGIVYNESGRGVAVYVMGKLRVNGLADEPKRLGYILFVASFASYYLSSQVNSKRRKQLLWILSSGCIVVSFLTYSGSYIVSATVTGMIILFTSTHLVRPAIVMLVLIVFVGFFAPSTVQKYGETLYQLFDDRSIEIDEKIGAVKVYRQEFYALDYMGKYPETFLVGVGIGRYNLVLNREYGSGAGYSLRGDIAPLNSQFYEILFDLGALGILIFYGGLAMLVVKIGKQSMLAFTFWSLLIFLTLQSLSIQNLQLTVFVAGGGVAYLRFWKLRNHTDPRMIATGYGLK